MIHHLFIINPAAGSYNRTEEASAVIHKICRARKLSYEIRVSTAPGECARIAKEACEKGGELRIYACGGDGTLNEVMNGVVEVLEGLRYLWILFHVHTLLIIACEEHFRFPAFLVSRIEFDGSHCVFHAPELTALGGTYHDAPSALDAFLFIGCLRIILGNSSYRT